MLISKMPGYQAGQRQYGYHTSAGSAYSNHAPESSWDQVHGQSIQPTFVPSDADDDLDDDNDFDPDDELDDDSSEPGSIRVDEDEDADFEESSFGDDDVFNEVGTEPVPGSSTKSPGSDTKTSGSGTKATKTGFAGEIPDSVEALDFDSFMIN